VTDLEEVAVHALGEKDGYLVNHWVILVFLAEIMKILCHKYFLHFTDPRKQ